MLSGIGSTIAQGMAFGAGSEVAHQAVRSVMGGGGHGHTTQAEPQQQQQQAQPQYAQQQNPCEGMSQNFMNCIKQNNNDISFCQQYMDAFTQCQRDYGLVPQQQNQF